jgi:hypothetical protein
LTPNLVGVRFEFGHNEKCYTDESTYIPSLI